MLNPPADTADHVNTVIAFYATSLSHTVGKGYVPPSLSSLARWWFDVSSMCYLLFSLTFLYFAGDRRFVSQATCGWRRGLFLKLELLV